MTRGELAREALAGACAAVVTAALMERLRPAARAARLTDAPSGKPPLAARLIRYGLTGLTLRMSFRGFRSLIEAAAGPRR